MWFLLNLGVFVVAYALNGIAFSVLWGWFIVPTFDLPALTALQAIGIGITVGMLTTQYVPKNESETKKAIVIMLIEPIFALALGGIVYRIM